jgi:hypothetical protein
MRLSAMNCNKIKTIIIKITTNQPKITTNQPKITTTQPKITTNQPKITTNQPNELNKLTKNDVKGLLVFALFLLNIVINVNTA